MKPYHHIAFVVADLPGAIERFSVALDTEFMPIQQGTEVRWAYSLTGPPYVELIEATDDEFFSASTGDKLHHLGVAHPDEEFDAVLERAHAEATFECQGVGTTWFSKPDALHSARIEHFKVSAIPFIDDMVAGRRQAGS